MRRASDGMHVYHPDLAARSVPRYTSYPTAAEFGPAVGAGDLAAALAMVVPGTPISLYFHIPYCREICWYCGCNTGAIGRADRLDAYVAALECEIETIATRMAGRVVSVHFGGGSPNALTNTQLLRLARRVRSAFDINTGAEWAAELDPRLLDQPQADTFAQAGFTRISLGVQTFAPRIQAAINRLQPFRQVARGVADLRAAGIERINFDLMYGLPGQTLDDIAATIARALPLAPDRIAMFGYAHLPRMLPRQKMIHEVALPGNAARFWQSALAHDLLVEGRYDAIGFDHFARPGDSLALAAREGRLRRNFQGFTDDPARVLIGMGASAISAVGDVIVQNEKHVGSWRLRAANGALPAVRGVRRTAEDRLRGEIVERLLCDGSIDVAVIARRHGRPPFGVPEAWPRLAELADRGIVALRGWQVALLPAGRPYARLAAAAFDAYRPATEQRFSRAV